MIGGRFFNDYTLESLSTLIAKFEEFDELEVIDVWQEAELLRGIDQTWINGLVRKVLDNLASVQKIKL